MRNDEEEKKKKMEKFADSYVDGNGLRGFIQIWNVASAKFGEDIMELWVYENCDFVVPVNILTSFAYALFSWAPCVLIRQLSS